MFRNKCKSTRFLAIVIGSDHNSIGASLDNADRAAAERNAQRALETAPAGQSLPWSNPNTGHSGSFIPAAPYKTAGGQYCREYTQKINVGGKTQEGYGTACRQPDGSWQIQPQ